MISKLPRWIWIGGFFLTISAGFINSIALLQFRHQAVSHITGTVTKVSITFFKEDWTDLIYLSTILLSFLGGAVLSGLIIRDSVLRFGKRYGAALLIESGLLFLSFINLSKGLVYGEYFASAACGLQNAMVTTYSGAVIRTTHMTGIVSDLGILLGQWARGGKLDKLRGLLLITLFSGFVIGGILGTYSFLTIGVYALIIPASIIGLLGAAYFIRKLYVMPHKKRKVFRKVVSTKKKITKIKISALE